MTHASSMTARLSFVDQVRGIALVGIVVVNAPFLAIALDGAPPSSQLDGLDAAVKFAIEAFAQGKFYLLFSFLFGYSISRFIKPDSPDAMRRYKRRLVALAALGFLHAVLLFIGDILFTYALLGSILVLVFKRSDRAAATLSGIAGLLALGVLGVLALVPAESVTQNDPVSAGLEQAMRSGTFLETVRARLKIWPFILVFLGVLNYGLALAMMGLGIIAGRRCLLDEPARHGRLWSTCRWVGITVGLPLGLLAAVHSESPWAIAVSFGSAPLLSAGYLGALTWLHERVPSLLHVFESAGRMSLTCYILESLVLSLIYCGYGLGYFGTHGLAMVTGVAIASALATEIAAKLWLTRFDAGPLEMLVGWWCRA